MARDGTTDVAPLVGYILRAFDPDLDRGQPSIWCNQEEYVAEKPEKIETEKSDVQPMVEDEPGLVKIYDENGNEKWVNPFEFGKWMGEKTGFMREFATGATRDTDNGKYDYEGFLSPDVLEEFAKYMHEHRLQKDGELRSSDNWQKGMPRDEYMKSLCRHFHDAWKGHRHNNITKTMLCAMMFNTMGYLLEMIKEENNDNGQDVPISEDPRPLG